MKTLERILTVPFLALATIALWMIATIMLILAFCIVIIPGVLLLEADFLEVVESSTKAIWRSSSGCAHKPSC